MDPSHKKGHSGCYLSSSTHELIVYRVTLILSEKSSEKRNAGTFFGSSSTGLLCMLSATWRCVYIRR